MYHAVYDDYANASTDLSPRCISANICDTVPVAGECGPDGLACVTSAAKRQQAVKDAMKASWSAYKYVPMYTHTHTHTHHTYTHTTHTHTHTHTHIHARAFAQLVRVEKILQVRCVCTCVHARCVPPSVRACVCVSVRLCMCKCVCVCVCHPCRRYAWGKDELVHTASGDRGRDWLWMGLSIVDNLDTLLLMGMKKEYKQARDWAVRRLDLDAAESEGSVSVCVCVCVCLCVCGGA